MKTALAMLTAGILLLANSGYTDTQTGVNVTLNCEGGSTTFSVSDQSSPVSIQILTTALTNGITYNVASVSACNAMLLSNNPANNLNNTIYTPCSINFIAIIDGIPINFNGVGCTTTTGTGYYVADTATISLSSGTHTLTNIWPSNPWTPNISFNIAYTQSSSSGGTTTDQIYALLQQVRSTQLGDDATVQALLNSIQSTLDSNTATLADLDSQLKALATQISALSTSMNNLTTQEAAHYNDLSTQLAALTAKIYALTTAVAALQSQQTTDTSNLQAELAALSTQLSDTTTSLGQKIDNATTAILAAIADLKNQLATDRALEAQEHAQMIALLTNLQAQLNTVQSQVSTSQQSSALNAMKATSSAGSPSSTGFSLNLGDGSSGSSNPITAYDSRVNGTQSNGTETYNETQTQTSGGTNVIPVTKAVNSY